jgi:RimJ/RimL family protein N-acetyltransferase
MIVGKKTRLRALERDDLAVVVNWLNDPETRRTLASWRPLSMTDENRWFDHVSGSQNDYVFVIEALDGDKPRTAGSCGVHEIDWKNRTGIVGIVLSPQERGKGLGTDAMYTLVKYLHGEMGLNHVELEVFPTNAAGVKSYESIGFVKEGIRRGAYFRDGKFIDLMTMSCLPHELKEPR